MNELLTVENRKSLKLNGVQEVKAFCDREVRLVLKDKSALKINGELLKIDLFSKENGDFCLSGKVNQIKFSQNEGLLRRAFK